MGSVVSKLIDYLDTVPPLLLLVVAFTTTRWERRDYILYYLWCQLFFNGYANLLNELRIDNLFAYSLNFSWTYFILSLFFIKIYVSRYLSYLLLCFILIYQINSLLTVQTSTIVPTFDSLSYGLVSLMLTLYCLIYYVKQLSAQPKHNIMFVTFGTLMGFSLTTPVISLSFCRTTH